MGLNSFWLPFTQIQRKFMFYFNRLSLIFSVFMVGLLRAEADTSEMNIGISFGGGLTKEHTLKSDRGQLSEEDLSSDSGVFSVSGEIGLGLSFATTAWLKMGYHRSVISSRWYEHSIICPSAARTQELNRGAALNGQDVGCSRLRGVFRQHSGSLLIGGTYRPFDHISPVISGGAGVRYMAAIEGDEVIDTWSDEGRWSPSGYSGSFLIKPRWYSRLFAELGGEIRIASRWGARVSAWSDLEGLESELRWSIGLACTLLHYHYVRLL